MTVTLPDGRELTLPLIQCAVIGRPGSGKSHFLASFPKPLLVLASDPLPKMQPYFGRGVADAMVHVGQFGQPVQLIHSATTGNAIIQLESYHDDEPNMPRAMTALIARAEQLKSEVAAGRWASVVLDSWSQLEYVARQRRMKGPFAIGNPDGRAVYANAKDDLQQLLNSRLVPLPCNIGIAFHIEEKMSDEGGAMLYTIKAIGALKSDIGSVMAERYYAVNLDGTNRQLRTRDIRFDCCTLIEAPDPCANEYQALFQNWIAKRAAAPPVNGAAAAQPEPAASAAATQEEPSS